MTTPRSAPLGARLDGLMAAAPGMAKAFFQRPSLLSLTAGVAGLAAIANGVAAAAPAAEASQATRLGTSIQQSMRDSDRSLARQKRGLDLREQAVRATEERLKAELLARQAEGGAPAGGAAKPAEQTEPFDELARIYQTMKPAKAAVIFERLDLEVQTQVARRMRERSTALILSNMSPAGAVQLSMALAGKRVAKPQSAQRPEGSNLQPNRDTAARSSR